jgi:hypothetical protein
MTRAHEVTFAGDAAPAVGRGFHDVDYFDVVLGAGTTLCAQPANRAAFMAPLDRVKPHGLGTARSVARGVTIPTTAAQSHGSICPEAASS